MVRQCDDKITTDVMRVAVIGEYVTNKGCRCSCGATWMGNVWKKKDEYIKSRKFGMSVSMSYFSRFALKSRSKTSVYSLMKAFLISLLGTDY